MLKEKKLIFVLGMHRSGTSAYARLLNLLGVDLGDRLIDPQPGVNDKGFWEHVELVRINEAILSSQGSSWYDLRPFPESWWQAAEFDVHRREIQRFLEQGFPGKDLVALKDPRLCRLLPLWLSVVKGSDWLPLALIVRRAPQEVAASLCKRDPLPASTAYLLWLRYLRDAESASRALPRSIVSYSELLCDWQATASRMASELAISWPEHGAETAARISREIDVGLRHHLREADSSPTPLSRLADEVDERLSGLAGESRPESGEFWRVVDDLFQGCEPLMGAASESNQRLIDVNKRLHTLGEELHSLGVAHAHALKVIEERDRQLAERGDQLSGLGAAHTHALKIIEERDRQLARIRAHPVAGRACRVFNLGEKDEQS